MSLQIYTNGYVTFGLNFESRYPDSLSKYMLSYHKRQTANKQGFAMLAPLWTDNDARYGDVYYHIYDLTMPGSTATDQARVKVWLCFFLLSISAIYLVIICLFTFGILYAPAV